MSPSERKKFAALKRRANYLLKQTADDDGKKMGFARAELSALEWALGIIEERYETEQ